MSKKQEQEALTSLEKLDELTKDIIENTTSGGDTNFRNIVFAGLTQTKNPILLAKMQDLLFEEKESDLKKTIILGIFNHKEMYKPVLEYGEQVITMSYLDQNYNDKESFIFVLDALIELAQKNRINEFENAIPLLFEIYKIACSEKSTSIIADKLLQQFLNSNIGKVKILQNEFIEIIKDPSNELNSVVIAIDILARAQYGGLLELLKEILETLRIQEDYLEKIIPLLDISTLALSYYNNSKYNSKLKELLDIINSINLKKVKTTDEIKERIKRRIKKIQNNINSLN